MNISYTDTGSGKPIVLLHGYLETKEVWADFAALLAQTNRVLCIDIPGHGESSNYAEAHTMESIAELLDTLFIELNLNNFVIVGHSMGGYVALAYAEMYCNKISGLVLLHSSVYADTHEKAENRLREISLIQEGKKELIFKSNLPRMFADSNVVKYGEVIGNITSKALTHSENGICALLRGMIERSDKQQFIEQFSKPLLFIFGMKDNYIAVEAANKMGNINKNARVIWLENSGHMGFVEEKEITAEAIVGFMK